MRMDLVQTPVRVSSVDPGMVETEFSLVRYHGDKARADKTYQGFTPLHPDDVAEAVLFCATRPPHMTISEMIVMPTAQASVLVVNRK
jgi:serine 3-dehydrogenase